MAETMAIVQAAGLPGVRTMLDCCAAGNSEDSSPAEQVDRWWPSGCLVHVQLNDRNRLGAGQGEDRFALLLAAAGAAELQGEAGHGTLRLSA